MTAHNHLHARQFKAHVAARAARAYDVKAGKFLDYMDRRGAATAAGMDAQLQHLDRLTGADRK